MPARRPFASNAVDSAGAQSVAQRPLGIPIGAACPAANDRSVDGSGIGDAVSTSLAIPFNSEYLC